jgi:membrane-bound metal-dependent hydrolase YbcI (DUF457 family)
MANCRKHVAIGALIGACVGFGKNCYQFEKMNKNIEAKFDWLKLFKDTAGGAALGAGASIIPDILEPPTNPHHRKIFHSLAMVVVASIAVTKIKKSNLPVSTKHRITTAGLGFISHLIMDSTTPYGLPII